MQEFPYGYHSKSFRFPLYKLFSEVAECDKYWWSTLEISFKVVWGTPDPTFYANPDFCLLLKFPVILIGFAFPVGLKTFAVHVIQLS